MSFDYRSSLSFPIKRFYFLKFLLLSIFLVLTGRLCYLHIWKHRFLNQQGDVRYYREMTLQPKRGQIFDRNNILLAGQKRFYSVWAVPELLRLNNLTQQNLLKKHLSLSATEWQLKWRSHKKFVYLRRFINDETKKELEKNQFLGIHFMTEFKRFYPCSNACSQLIGFTNQQQEGLEGIEKAQQHLLSGTAGLQRLIKDIKGHLLIDVAPQQEPIHGQNIQLTINATLQQYIYQLLKQTVYKHQADSASAIVIDTSNAEILSAVNYPSFDPNEINKEITNIALYKNKAFLDVFEPGSTVKPFTIIAGLQHQVIQENSIIDTKPLMIGKKVITDTHEYEQLNIADILQKSSNTGSSHIALLMKPHQLSGVLKQVGFTKKAIDIMPSSKGYLPLANTWTALQQATISFGHGINVSLLQLAKAYTAIATGDVPEKLRLFSYQEPINYTPFLSEHLRNTIQKMLVRVTEKGGTAENVAIENIKIAGKTGTAHKLKEGRYVNDYVSSFVGMGPMNTIHPKYVIAVMIDSPKANGHFGGVVAAPVFKDIMLYLTQNKNNKP